MHIIFFLDLAKLSPKVACLQKQTQMNTLDFEPIDSFGNDEALLMGHSKDIFQLLRHQHLLQPMVQLSHCRLINVLLNRIG